ncbi:hypothetical protein OH76DRAFT_1459063 [Lentinus brumalis]|uniref:CxC2-like cysteine cluster KDZ transposase-associated domain-containing protein n=1 Tax=Lentinus brumalis TaxID=2498619 RepID=A0A371CN51_9APHY|nr:hypothetical protein OH76DRAFT_1459063 [Polyporus brumalis]
MVKKRSAHFTHHRISSDSDSDGEADGDTVSRAQLPTETQRHIAYRFDNDEMSRRTSYVPIPTSPTPKRARMSPDPSDGDYSTPEETGGGLDEEELQYLYSRIENMGVEEDPDIPRTRTAGDRPLLVWRVYVQKYLDELMRLEGRGDFSNLMCPGCDVNRMGYRCDDCDDSALYCNVCTKARHLPLPLHRVKKWTGTHFERLTLKSLGLRVQLGHRPGESCYNPQPAFGDGFVVVDLHGIHEIGLDFCGCERAVAHSSQLLRYRWFPSTATNPRTAATFRVLESFHLLSCQSKVSAFEFYTALSRNTDNTGTQPPKDRYPSFLLMMRQWRHLKMLKRAGRGNIPDGAGDLPAGSCVVECPACPHPGKNLPPDWEDAPTKRSWLYKLNLAIDANFRMKRKKVSDDTSDPDLNAGCAYFVEEHAYKAHLTTFDKDLAKAALEKSCNTHDAVKLANLKNAVGLSATGIATVDCSRHDMKRPCSVGDLQKGERQVNIDYLLNSSLTHNAPTRISVSYDVGCIYSINAPTRWERYEFDTFSGRIITWSVPMFHLNAHRERCRSVYSPYLLIYYARMDGEGVERRWAMINGYAPATREMGPGSRRDVLDDVFGDQNWAKVTKLAATLLRRIKVAVVERATHVLALQQFTESLPPESVADWTALVVTWEAAPTTARNPYEYRRSHTSQPALRVELAEQDALDIREGRATTIHEYYSSSTLIVVGMEIEDQQRKLIADISNLGAHPTDLQRAKVLERQNALQRRIDGWRAIQQLFMPAVATLFAQPTHPDPSSLPQNLPLFLPSTACPRISVARVLLEHEWALRQAQAYDSLTDLRGHLEVRAYIYKYKDQNMRGQRDGLRSRDIVNSIESKLKMDALRYRTAYMAMTTLSAALGKTDWRGGLQPLNEGDIRHVTADDGSGSEGRKELSWIWKASGAGLRVEWCKARARAMRWSEEVELLQEEMRRTQEYHNWRASWWQEHVGRTFQQRAELTEGMRAYAHRQAAIRRRMSEYCKRAWAFVGAWPWAGTRRMLPSRRSQ